MKKSIERSSHGFTLLEIMITITIMGVIGVLISQVFFTTTRVNTKSELLKDMNQNGQFAMDTMSRMIRASSLVNSTCALAGTQSTSLQITNPNGDPTTFECSLDSGGATRIASTSATAQSDFLTSQNVSLGGSSCADGAMSLSFVCTSFADQPSRIRIQYSLRQVDSAADAKESASQSFETTVSVRN